MKKFRCVVTRTDEYVIELDESKMTPEWMAEFANSMYPFKSLKEHAEHLAQHRARFGESFVEGYGVAFVNGMLPFGRDLADTTLGINIQVVSEDADVEVEVKEENVSA